MRKTAQTHKNLGGFTLIELLVVIAIIAILAAVVLLLLKPAEIMARGRDANRLTDLMNVHQAIGVAVQESTASGTATILCVGGLTGGACTGSSNTGTRATDGTGWVKVNLGAQKSVSVATLPIDPSNTTANHYTYCSDGTNWELSTALESAQYGGKASTDGGNDPALYEVGSSLSLIAPGGTPCAY